VGKIGGRRHAATKDFLANAHATCDKNSGAPADTAVLHRPDDQGGCAADACLPACCFSRATAGRHSVGFQAVGRWTRRRFSIHCAPTTITVAAGEWHPKVLDVDDLKKLDQAAMQRTHVSAIRHQYPCGHMAGRPQRQRALAAIATVAQCDQEYVVTYPLMNGCHACRRLGLARWLGFYAKEISANHYIPTPPPKL